jgi:hypothetical protein
MEQRIAWHAESCSKPVTGMLPLRFLAVNSFGAYFNLLKFVQIMFKNSVRTAKKTPHFTITKINWLTLFKEMIAVYTENHTKLINAK